MLWFFLCSKEASFPCMLHMYRRETDTSFFASRKTFRSVNALVTRSFTCSATTVPLCEQDNVDYNLTQINRFWLRRKVLRKHKSNSSNTIATIYLHVASKPCCEHYVRRRRCLSTTMLERFRQMVKLHPRQSHLET